MDFEKGAWDYFNNTGKIDGYLTYVMMKKISKAEIAKDFSTESVKENDTEIIGDCDKGNKN